MRINFLAASDNTPLAKQYTKNGEEYITKPYPFVRDFNSFQYNVDSIEDFYTVLKEHSQLHHCLLKGPLDRKLIDESRAGHTDANEPSNFIVLDLDFDEGFPSVDQFLQFLDPRLADVSYIVQHSNSAGITAKVGLRTHVFIMTEEAFVPAHMKMWLQEKNLTVPALRNLIDLSANGMTLRYPLDITTCQNDKLIYIAQPLCEGFDDPLGEDRIKLVSKGKPALAGKPEYINPQAVADLADTLVQELRAKHNIRKKKPKYANNNSAGLLLNPDIATVSAVKEARGFTYLNLNNGDSWAYYYPTDNPEVLFNFKGEPSVRLRDIAPEYYKTISPVAPHEGGGIIPHVFREKTEDTYYNILYNQDTGTIDSLDAVSSKERLTDFLAQYDKPLPDPIEDWRIEFDPRTNVVFNERNKWINSFNPSEFMRTNYDPVAKPPMTIEKILRSICVDEETYDWVVNWLAFKYQRREKSGICPIFHGVPGTGKGLLHEHILQPLFGYEHTPKITTQQFTDQFNGWQERALIVVWDEANTGDTGDHSLINKIKHIITESHTMLRTMRRNPRKIRNYLDMVITTNHTDPIPLEPNDRRFTVAPPQMTPIHVSEAEVGLLPDELPIFAAFLQHYNVDAVKATTVLRNKAREDMVTTTTNTVDALFHNLRDGNFDYFLSFRRAKPVMSPNDPYLEYERVLKRWATLVGTKNAFVSRDEAMAMYSYIIKPFNSPAKFKKMGDKYHLIDTRGRLDGKRLRGWKTSFTTEDDIALKQLLESDNVVNLKTG